MIVIIDYKTGNVGSIVNMLKKVGVGGIVSSDPDDIRRADKLILPGVGAFDQGMKNLNNSGLIPVIEEQVIGKGVLVLGICLGMQLFAQRSEEGNLNGLGWIDAEVRKFDFKNQTLKVPHMNWNTTSILKQDVLLKDMPEVSKFYFVHSYYFVCNDKNDGLLTANYGHDFIAAVRKDNIIGVQFHPEKSHKFGMKLLKNFSEL